MKYIMMLIVSVNAFAISNLENSNCFKSYQFSFNKKLLYNIYTDLNDSNRTIMDLYEKKVIEAATFSFDTQSEIFYPKLLKSAKDLKLNPEKFQSIIIQGFTTGHFCKSVDLFNPVQVKEYVASILKLDNNK